MDVAVEDVSSKSHTHLPRHAFLLLDQTFHSTYRSTTCCAIADREGQGGVS